MDIIPNSSLLSLLIGSAVDYYYMDARLHRVHRNKGVRVYMYFLGFFGFFFFFLFLFLFFFFCFFFFLGGGGGWFASFT